MGRVTGAIAVDDLVPADWPEVAAIYAEGIATRLATFETEVSGWTEWDAKMLPGLRLVARDATGGGPAGAPRGAVLGWAAVQRVSPREVYRGVAEDSVYVAALARGRGVGRALLDALVERSEAAGIWTLQASVFPENAASLALHAACGFRVVGRRERLARLDDAWRDILLLERRSARSG